MSDTPETDAFIDGLNHEVKTAYTMEGFARRLERERNYHKKQAESNGKLAHNAMIEANELREQRDELLKLVQEFCEGQRWAADIWKKQDHIKPLFDLIEP